MCFICLFCCLLSQISNTEKTVGLGPFRGLIECQLALPVSGIIHGEYIPAEVEIFNQSSRTIRWVSLSLFKVTVRVGLTENHSSGHAGHGHRERKWRMRVRGLSHLIYP